MNDPASTLAELRRQMSELNLRLMDDLNGFFDLATRVGEAKDRLGLPHRDPAREAAMMNELLLANRGPMPSDALKRIFREILNASLAEMDVESRLKLKVNRLPDSRDAVIRVGGVDIGGPDKVLIGGPCAVESLEQTRATAQTLAGLGVKILRGGAFKPRTSPYSFQGLEEDGLRILRQVADEFGLAVVTEVLSVRDVELVARYADMLQVGTRNMFNYSLLKELGGVGRPVLLKRGMMATVEEFVLAAEYVYLGGNSSIVLCERGIRTFETSTRNTLDISAIPILKRETTLPVVVDISHSLGRKDILLPIAHAALAAGADGLMFEAHYNPVVAMSDCDQQLDPRETEELVAFVQGLLPHLGRRPG